MSLLKQIKNAFPFMVLSNSLCDATDTLGVIKIDFYIAYYYYDNL